MEEKKVFFCNSKNSLPPLSEDVKKENKRAGGKAIGIGYIPLFSPFLQDRSRGTVNQ